MMMMMMMMVINCFMYRPTLTLYSTNISYKAFVWLRSIVLCCRQRLRSC